MLKKKSNSQELSVAERIKLRNSWLRIFIITVIAIVISMKLMESNFDSIFEGFNFSDLLSLFLAIFSISLVALFYFKATETTNFF